MQGRLRHSRPPAGGLRQGWREGGRSALPEGSGPGRQRRPAAPPGLPSMTSSTQDIAAAERGKPISLSRGRNARKMDRRGAGGTP
jgi:hypothetical protein